MSDEQKEIHEYKITVERVRRKFEKTTRWGRVLSQEVWRDKVNDLEKRGKHDEAGKLRDYGDIATEEWVTMKDGTIYEQTVNELDLKAVIAAVNGNGT